MPQGSCVFKVCPARFFGRAHLGSIQGVLQTTNVASTGLGPLIIGLAHDASGSYSPILIGLASTMCVLGALGTLFLKTPRRPKLRGDGQSASSATKATLEQPSEGVSLAVTVSMARA